MAKSTIKKTLLLNPLYILCTTAAVLIIIGPVLILFKNMIWVVLMVNSVILLALGIANKIKIDYRQTGFTPIDLLILREATSMSGALNKKSTKVLFLKFSLILIILTIIPIALKDKFNFIAVGSGISLAAALMLIAFFIASGPKFNFRLNVFKTGIVIFFISYFRDPVKLPGRNKKTINTHNLKFQIEDKEEKPDIIIIQSESFSNPTFLGKEKFNADILPFFHSLKEEVYSFDISTRAFGGGTVNTEFEILTGLSTVFFPKDTTIFSRYIKKPLASIGSILKQHGYKSAFIHPYESWYYNRVKAYKNLGFDKFISNKSFRIPDKGYIDDKEVNQKIIENLDNGYNFIFGVTMQNHTPYNFNSHDEKIIYLEEMKNKDTKVHFNNYLSGLKKSDVALESLTKKLSTRKKKTILLFYGDHLPIINQDPDFYEDVAWTKNKLGSKNYYYDLSISPGFIWTNKDRKLKPAFETIDSTLVLRQLLKEASLSYPDYIDEIFKYFTEEKVASFHRDFLVKNGEIYGYGTLEYLEFYKKLQKVTAEVFYDELWNDWTYSNPDFNLD